MRTAGLLVIGTSLLCSPLGQTATGAERLMVAPETASCTGVAPQACLKVKAPGDFDWRLHHGAIEGFTYEPGFAWTILVDERRVENPPADAPGRVLVLREVVTRHQIPPTLAGQLEGLRRSGWRLAKVRPAEPFDEATWRGAGATLIFDKEPSRIAGRGGCNRWFGAWMVDADGTLKPSPFGSTQMACPDPAMAIEAAYLDLLSHARTLHWWGTEVEVESRNGSRLLFEELLE